MAQAKEDVHANATGTEMRKTFETAVEQCREQRCSVRTRRRTGGNQNLLDRIEKTPDEKKTLGIS